MHVIIPTCSADIVRRISREHLCKDTQHPGLNQQLFGEMARLTASRRACDVNVVRSCKILHTKSRKRISLLVFHTENQFRYFPVFPFLFTFNGTHGNEDSAIMFGKTRFGKSIYGTAFKDINFVPLPTATICVQCELISTNSRTYCLACGSQAVIGLSRVLGGSLSREQTAHLITDAELDSLVRDLLRTVPDPTAVNADWASDDRSRVPSLALRSQLRVASAAHPVSGFRAVSIPQEIEIQPAELDLEPAISAITERAQHLTGATGAAIALRAGDEIVCRARAGRTAPDLGVRLQTDTGISAEAVRSGEIMLCHDAERNPRVDVASCRRLGVRSILVSPLRHYRRTLGVFEVLSSSPGAFDDRDVATMQLLSSMMVAAISRISSLRQARIFRPAV